MADWWQRRARRSEPRRGPGDHRDELGIDIRDILPTVRVPTLVVHRTGDIDASVEGGGYIAERVPDARFIELPGDDHVPWIDADQVLAPIEAFVGEVAEPAEAAADGAERALAATLFTDIVGSTDLNVSMGDTRWTALLDRHDDRIGATSSSNGRAGGCKSTGDGVLAVFDGPAGASAPRCRPGSAWPTSGSASAAACTRARSSGGAMTWPVSASRSRRGWSRWVMPARSS